MRTLLQGALLLCKIQSIELQRRHVPGVKVSAVVKECFDVITRKQRLRQVYGVYLVN